MLARVVPPASVLFRSDVTAGCRSVCGSAAAADDDSDGVLPMEEEERPESVPRAHLLSATSAGTLCSGDPGVSGLLGRVSKIYTKSFLKHLIYI